MTLAPQKIARLSAESWISKVVPGTLGLRDGLCRGPWIVGFWDEQARPEGWSGYLLERANV